MRVIIADGVGLYRDLLRLALASNGMTVIGQARTADEAVALVDADPPDVVLLDIRMLPTCTEPTCTDDGLQAAVRIRARHPGVAVVLLSSYGEVEHAVRLVGELPDRVGYLLKERTASARELLDAIERVVAGGVVIDPDVVARLIARPRLDNPLRRLTERELEALALLAEGCSNAAIGSRMRIRVSTVEKHLNAVFRKLDLSPDGTDGAGADNARVRAVLAYLRHTGQIPAPRRPTTTTRRARSGVAEQRREEEDHDPGPSAVHR